MTSDIESPEDVMDDSSLLAATDAAWIIDDDSFDLDCSAIVVGIHPLETHVSDNRYPTCDQLSRHDGNQDYATS